MIIIFLWTCLSTITGDLVGKELILNGTGEITGDIINKYTPTLIESIKIEEGPDSIGEYAFKQCKNLKSIVLSNTIKSIKFGAFSQTQLKMLHIPSGVENIDIDYLFYLSNSTESFSVSKNNSFFCDYDRCIYNYEKTQLLLVPHLAKNISLYNGITSISSWAFYGFYDDHIVIPDSVSSLSTMTFVDCFGLIEIIFGVSSNLTEIPSNCFYQSYITKFVCPPKVKIIQSRAFAYCSVLLTFDVMIGSILETISNEAFLGCINMISVALPDSIKYMTSSSLSGCNSLINFKMTSPHFTIKEGTFYNKDLTEYIYVAANLTTFEVSKDIRNIGQTQFQRCENMTSLYVNPDNEFYYSDGKIIYQKSDNAAFCAAGGITEAIIKNTAPYIAKTIFKFMKKLTKVSFEEGSNCTLLTESAFEYCHELVEVNLPSTIQEIQSFCFQCCYKLSRIVLPRDLVSMASFSFYSSRNLNSITFEPGCQLRQIGERTFSNISCLKTVELPATLEDIAESAFSYCGIQCLNISSGTKIISVQAFMNCTELTELIFNEDSLLTTISESAFLNCTKLQRIRLPPKLTTISSSAFANCQMLSQIEFLEATSLETIGSLAFESAKIASFTVPPTLTSISPTSFANCAKLTQFICQSSPHLEVTEGILYNKTKSSLLIVPAGREISIIKSGTKSIESQALYYCIKLKTLIFESPCEVSSIGKYSFYQCNSLEEIEIPNSVSYIEAETFVSCDILYNITFADGSLLESIRPSTFSDCRNLQYVIFSGSSNLKTIESKAFYGLPLREFRSPPLVKAIGSSAFENCTKLKLIDLSLCNQLTEIQNECFKDCFDLSSALLPESVTIIGENSFKGCESLKSMVLSKNVTIISSGAFMRSGILSISLGDYIERIDSDAFASCINLVSANITGKLQSMGPNAFGSCPNLEFVYYCGARTFNDVNAFSNSNNDLIIYTLRGYMSTTFCGRAVERVMRRCGYLPTSVFTLDANAGLAIVKLMAFPLIEGSSKEGD